MCKKIGMAVVLVAGGLFLMNTVVGSYVSTAFNKVRCSAKNQVPIEFEIDRLRNEVANLVPEMKKNLSAIAEEMVTVENLREEIAVTKANLKRQKDNILIMTKDLEGGATRLTYDGKDYSASRIREKLARDFASFQRCQDEVKSKEQLLEAREKALDAARDQLASMKTQKQELELQLAQLEADLKVIRLAQTRNKFQVDDSKLAQCKATLAEIRNRLKVEKINDELHGEFANDSAIPVEKKAKSAGELAKEVRKYFDADKDLAENK